MTDDTSERLREQWLYETIADPDCTAWNCPACGTRNQIVSSLVECRICGYELDPDRVRDALKERES